MKKLTSARILEAMDRALEITRRKFTAATEQTPPAKRPLPTRRASDRVSQQR
jgi:hypothetical protein